MSRTFVLLTSAVAALAVFSAGAAVLVRRYPTALSARYYREASPPVPGLAHAAPILTTLDARPDTAALRAHAGEVPAQQFSAVWEGYLLTPASREYQIELESDDGSRLYLDGTLVIDNWGLHEARAVRTSRVLSGGYLPIRLEYQQLLGEARLELRWDGASQNVLRPLDPNDVSPLRPFPFARQARVVLFHSVPFLVATWSALVAAVFFVPGLVWLVNRLQPDKGPRWLLAGVVGVTVFSNAIGSWWGLPPWHWFAWTPDEVGPLAVLDAVNKGFAHGWHDVYPAGYYYLLAWLSAPTLLAAKLGLIAAAIPDTTTYLTLFIVARLASVMAAAATIVLVHLIGQELYGSRAGALAAFVLAFTIPFGFYAKVANPDIPFVFWFALAFWFYVNVVKRGRAVDHYGYAIAATLAICTKDQAYALFVLPSLHVALVAWQSVTSGSRPIAVARRLAAPVLAAVLLFAIIHNFAFNFGGFVTHVRVLSGPQSGAFRMFSSDIRGQVRLLADTLPLFRWMFGWAGVALIALGFWRIWRLDPSRRHGWVVLPAVSYYLTFIAVVGYHYDRYWLPVAIVAALVAGVALDWLLRPGAGQGLRRLAAVSAMALTLWRGLSADALLLIDSRYDAERWLREHVPPGVTAVHVGVRNYLPRFRVLEIPDMPASIEQTIARRPQFVVVNLEFMRRYPAGSPEAQWWEWFRGPGSRYAIVYRNKQRPAWSALSYEPRLYTGVEDPYTNLGKVNPDIAVFERR